MLQKRIDFTFFATYWDEPWNIFLKNKKLLPFRQNLKLNLSRAYQNFVPHKDLFLVTSNLPWFFQYEYEYDPNGYISGYDYTSLFLDETLYYFWILWQFLVHTLVPFIVLLIINFLILWKLTSSKQIGDNIKFTNQIDGLRRHTR